MTTSSRFAQWVAQAQPGEEFAYHNGLLARDRERNPEVETMASMAMSAYTFGLVQLFQRRLPFTSYISGRLSAGGSLYIARRTATPVPDPRTQNPEEKNDG